MTESIKIQHYKSPFGELIIGSFKEELVLCDWRFRKMRTQINERLKKNLHADLKIESSKIISQTIEQLKEFFSGKRELFTLPIKLVGSDFQKSVWNELKNIPYGETESYLGLSKRLGNVKAIRAVASANGANAISIIIPCHRVIGLNGKLTGYAGGLGAKKQLLELENVLPQKQLKLF